MAGKQSQEKTYNRSPSILEPYRALDLAGFDGYVCGKVLADMGADVIKVEKPGGDSARDIGPFCGDIPDRERSLSWFAYNTNKRGITLDIEKADGREILRDLVKKADFLIESFHAGYMEGLGVGYDSLAKVNPRLIMASITPFGSVGPYREFSGSDIVIQAASGMMYNTGDPDRAPLQVGYPQSHLFAGLEAAVGCVIALNYREATGEGQHIDVSMQRSVLQAMFQSVFSLTATGELPKRRAGIAALLGTQCATHTVWACEDGYVYLAVFGAAPLGSPQNNALTKLGDWIEGEHKPCPHLRAMQGVQSAPTQDQVDGVEREIATFFSTRGKMELFEKAFQLGLGLVPLYTARDMLEDRQLLARGYWQEVFHEDLGVSVRYPATWGRSTETSLKTLKRAPKIGEHNWEIYGQEMGLTRKRLAVLKAIGVI